VLHVHVCARWSQALRTALSRTLALGNALNSGTAKGSAKGIKLESLAKLSDTRTSDGSSTLLHYLAAQLDDAGEHASVATLQAELSHVGAAASTVVWADVAAETASLRKELHSLKVVRAGEGAAADTGAVALHAFHTDALQVTTDPAPSPSHCPALTCRVHLSRHLSLTTTLTIACASPPRS
jgi:hypothetical protein